MIYGSLFLSLLFSASSLLFSQEAPLIRERVYVESPTDTDLDGQPDRIYVEITRPKTDKKLPSIYKITPYSLPGSQVRFHNVDVELLPQDEPLSFFFTRKSLNSGAFLTKKESRNNQLQDNIEYAKIYAHSLGTNKSTGCPTVGGMEETLAAKAVIEWLNGKARAFSTSGEKALADWSNGSVGMVGTSYNGTLPTMVASTGVEGLKAIIPIAAISSWYDYYRANGLVVGPGGYVGEDADILGKYVISRSSICHDLFKEIFSDIDRVSGDYNQFWRERDYTLKSKNIKAATFIVHGQSDWNVRQKHAIKLWEGLSKETPKRMFLHNKGHIHPRDHQFNQKATAWFDRYVGGSDVSTIKEGVIEVQDADGSWITQDQWPHEKTLKRRMYFHQNGELKLEKKNLGKLSFTDIGKEKRLFQVLKESDSKHALKFQSTPFRKETLISGTSEVSISLSVVNRKASNLTIALYEEDQRGQIHVITKGWADPQNDLSLQESHLLEPGQFYQVEFELEPKQYMIKKGSRLGVGILSTDYEHTMRPKVGTQIMVDLAQSYIDVWID